MCWLPADCSERVSQRHPFVHCAAATHDPCCTAAAVRVCCCECRTNLKRGGGVRVRGAEGAAASGEVSKRAAAERQKALIDCATSSCRSTTLIDHTNANTILMMRWRYEIAMVGAKPLGLALVSHGRPWREAVSVVARRGAHCRSAPHRSVTPPLAQHSQSVYSMRHSTRHFLCHSMRHSMRCSTGALQGTHCTALCLGRDGG